MEPIVLLGLIIVAYGGYVALADFWQEVTERLPRRSVGYIRTSGIVSNWRDHKPGVKKMAGMHV